MQIEKSEFSRLDSSRIELLILTLFLAVVAYSFYWLIFPLSRLANISDSIVFFMSWIGILLGIYIFITWFRLTGAVFTLYTIFMMFFFLFNFGQPIMWAFGVHIPEEIGNQPIYKGLGTPNNADIVNGQMITCISALMFHLGAIICYRPKGKVNRDSVQTDSATLKAIFIVSLVIGSIIIPITLYYTFDSLKVAMTLGYKALYYSDYAYNKSNLFIVAQTLFFPCLVGMLIGSKYNKKIKYFVYIVFIIYILLNLFAGDRGTWIYSLVILIWLSHVCYKPIKIKSTLKYLILSLIGIYIVGAIVSIRNVGLSNVTFQDIIDSFAFENSPIVLTIFEMGGTMKVVMVLLMYGWDIWPYANTYLLAILGMITNKVIYIFDLPFSLISDWFSQDYLGLSYGAGFSIIAEAVLNYGPYFSPFIMVALGYLITSLIYIDKKMKYYNRPLRMLFAVTTLNVFLPLTRNFFHLLLKEWFIGVLLFTTLILFIKPIIKVSKKI
jgi:oligosaccharide repeat unit polymerase